jgi:hypothetical protein
LALFRYALVPTPSGTRLIKTADYIPTRSPSLCIQSSLAVFLYSSRQVMLSSLPFNPPSSAFRTFLLFIPSLSFRPHRLFCPQSSSPQPSSLPSVALPSIPQSLPSISFLLSPPTLPSVFFSLSLCTAPQTSFTSTPQLSVLHSVLNSVFLPSALCLFPHSSPLNFQVRSLLIFPVFLPSTRNLSLSLSPFLPSVFRPFPQSSFWQGLRCSWRDWW